MRTRPHPPTHTHTPTHPPTHTHTRTPWCICTSVSGASYASCVSSIGGSQHFPGATPHLAPNVVRVLCVLRVLERLGSFAGDTQDIFNGSGRKWRLCGQRNILVRLTLHRGHLVEYVQSIHTSILMWSPWMMGIFAQCHSEEMCEAMLLRLI